MRGRRTQKWFREVIAAGINHGESGLRRVGWEENGDRGTRYDNGEIMEETNGEIAQRMTREGEVGAEGPQLAWP